jgi:nucleotide-binding universal stress UspA family protein
VVGLDGSLPAQQALRWAVALGDGLGMAIVAVHAVGPRDHKRDADGSARPWRQALSDLIERTWCAPLAGAATPHRTDVRAGPAVEVLLAATATERAALLVVGTRGMGTDPARALGSTSLQLLQAARVPVLVVPAAGRGWGRPGLVVAPRLLVAVDGSSPSLAALTVAAEIAGRLGGSLKVLHVFGPHGGHALDRTLTRVEAELRGIRERGLRAPTIVRSGEPAETILDVAEDMDADLVAVGSRSYGGQAELLPDSVARTVAGRAERPTLVVPAAGCLRRPPGQPAMAEATTRQRCHGDGRTRPVTPRQRPRPGRRR